MSHKASTCLIAVLLGAAGALQPRFRRPGAVAGCSKRVSQLTSTATTMHEVSQAVSAACSELVLAPECRARVDAYVELLLAYNERVNVYSKSAYDKLPFHVLDSLTLALHLQQDLGVTPRRGVLDIGSGSGLPAILIACVLPDVPVFAVESKSRKTAFLAEAGRTMGLANFLPLTQNVHELARSWTFDVDAVTAKAFKPLVEVGPIASKCVGGDSRLLVPVSEAQALELAIDDDALVRRGPRHLYYSEALQPSRGTAQRKLCSLAFHPA